VTSDDETHYEILGVDPGASKEAIRAAYQERVDAARADQTRESEAKRPNEGALGSARDEEARVRAAWQVLSDPYQRGRYDQSIEAPDAEGDVDADEDADDVGSSNGSRTPAPQSAREAARDARAERMANRPPGLFSSERPPTPPSWPPGLQPPPPRARFLAMMVDVLVLSILLFAQQALSTVVLDEMYPKETKALDRVTDQIDRLEICIDRRPSSRESEPAVCQAAEGAPLRKGQLEDTRDNLEDTQADLRNDMLAGQLALSFGTLAIMLLYLVPSSVRSGRTLGMRLLQIRAVQADGRPLTVQPAIARYGAPLVFALFLGSILGPLSFGIALFGVLTWPRNPNYQGLHDRLARTIVVDG